MMVCFGCTIGPSEHQAADKPHNTEKAARGNLERPFSYSDAWMDWRIVAHRPTSRADTGRALNQRQNRLSPQGAFLRAFYMPGA